LLKLDEDRDLVVEVKFGVPMTSPRIRGVSEALSRKQRAWESNAGRRADKVLITPGVFAEGWRIALENQKIQIWDRAWITDTSERLGLFADAQIFLESQVSPAGKRARESLIDELKALAPGKKTWVQYQDLITRILQYLFCPPLGNPITELANQLKVNRRGVILPNYSLDGFFRFLHSRYRAEFIVADAKNYAKLVHKNEILQMANYLSEHGSGLFGLIVARNGGDRGAD
jgi:hypothetical protein